jgi:hypothetical protein
MADEGDVGDEDGGEEDEDEGCGPGGDFIGADAEGGVCFGGFYGLGGEEEEDPYTDVRQDISEEELGRTSYLAPMTVVFIRNTYFSSIRYSAPGNRPNAIILSTWSSRYAYNVFLTSGEKGQGDYCPEFGFEALEQRCNGEDVEEHVDEVKMR